MPRISCGNERLDPGEECEVANRASDSRCVACRLPSPLDRSACGDKLITKGEECDDGNAPDLDGCSAACYRESGTCGNGFIESLFDEECEPGLMDPTLPFTCNAQTCRIQSQFCGNSQINPGEQCDNGTNNRDGPSERPQLDCRTDCSRSRCGDGVLDALELCDDHNRMMGDGCNQFCQTENLASGSGSGPVIIDLPFDLTGPNGVAGSTGPGVIAVMAAGAAAGWAWMRRRNR